MHSKQREVCNELLQAVHAHSCAAEGVSARNRALVAAALAQLHAAMGRHRHAAMHARAAASAALVTLFSLSLSLSLTHSAFGAFCASIDGTSAVDGARAAPFGGAGTAVGHASV
jgi:uncharacterized heparinase superfamily protein